MRPELTDVTVPDQAAMSRQRQVPVFLSEVIGVELEPLVRGLDELEIASNTIGSHEWPPSGTARMRHFGVARKTFRTLDWTRRFRTLR
jgi:hypothetical protein